MDREEMRRRIRTDRLTHPGKAGREEAEALLAALVELKEVGDALGTDETESALVAVAQKAHSAEQVIAVLEQDQETLKDQFVKMEGELAALRGVLEQIKEADDDGMILPQGEVGPSGWLSAASLAKQFLVTNYGRTETEVLKAALALRKMLQVRSSSPRFGVCFYCGVEEAVEHVPNCEALLFITATNRLLEKRQNRKDK